MAERRLSDREPKEQRQRATTNAAATISPERSEASLTTSATDSFIKFVVVDIGLNRGDEESLPARE